MLNILHSALVTVIILFFIDTTRHRVSYTCMTQTERQHKARSQVQRVPEENPEHGTHCTFLAGRWQNSNSTKPPLIGQAYFSTCCGGRLLLVALPLSQETVDRSNNSSLFEIQGYPVSPGIHNLTVFIYNAIPTFPRNPFSHTSTHIYIYDLRPTSAEMHPPPIQFMHPYTFIRNLSWNPSMPIQITFVYN